MHRRDFLKAASLVALAPSVPAFLARGARAAGPTRDGRMLVVIQLGGGNDGINTVVPYADEGYAKARKELRLPAERLLKIDDKVALHPSMVGAQKLLESGRLAIVQGVGYPNPNRSHDVSMAIWQTARFDPEEHKSYGWIGRALDGGQAAGAPSSVLVGNESPPVALRSRRSTTMALADLDDLTFADAPGQTKGRKGETTGAPADDLGAFVRRSALDAYAAADRLKEVARRGEGGAKYPTGELARRMGLIAQLIKAGFETPVFYAIQSGYDTHSVQLQTHATLLRDLSAAMLAFLDDLREAKLDDRVAVLVFSEFGRRAAENASQGTDHGTAGPVFLAGPSVKAGLVGATPSMTDLADGDLKSPIDFRRVYASVLEDWLGLPSAGPLGGEFEKLPLFQG